MNHENEQLTRNKLEELEAEPLPNREQMSVIRGVEPVPTPVLDPGGFTIEPVPADEV